MKDVLSRNVSMSAVIEYLVKAYKHGIYPGTLPSSWTKISLHSSRFDLVTLWYSVHNLGTSGYVNHNGHSRYYEWELAERFSSVHRSEQSETAVQKRFRRRANCLTSTILRQTVRTPRQAPVRRLATQEAWHCWTSPTTMNPILALEIEDRYRQHTSRIIKRRIAKLRDKKYAGSSFEVLDLR
jgi:hypothetical protein